jgi:prepilin-type N-terminal cleavage/methylation domain-containing protein
MEDQMRLRNVRGMTMIEVFVVLVLMSILLLGTVPRIGQSLRSSRVDRAAGLVALTLERSFTLASRQRHPVTVSCDCVNQAIEIRDAASGTLYNRWALGPDTEFQIDSLTFSEASVTVSPTGVATLPLTVTLSAGPANRQVTMSSAGLVRVVR